MLWISRDDGQGLESEGHSAVDAGSRELRPSLDPVPCIRSPISIFLLESLCVLFLVSLFSNS